MHLLSGNIIAHTKDKNKHYHKYSELRKKKREITSWKIALIFSIVILVGAIISFIICCCIETWWAVLCFVIGFGAACLMGGFIDVLWNTNLSSEEEKCTKEYDQATKNNEGVKNKYDTSIKKKEQIERELAEEESSYGEKVSRWQYTRDSRKAEVEDWLNEELRTIEDDRAARLAAIEQEASQKIAI